MAAVNSRGLGRLLTVVTVLVLLLCANAAYLVAANTGLLGAPPGVRFQWMFLAHLLLGLLLIPLFAVYVCWHGRRGLASDNTGARRAGIMLALSGGVVLVSGLLLTRGLPWIELQSQFWRSVNYWLHVAVPLLVLLLVLLHRRAGSGVRWLPFCTQLGVALLATGLLLILLPADGEQGASVAGPVDFAPSLASTADGRLVDPAELMMDDYCAACHGDIHRSWADSVHRFSSMNNPVYAFSFLNTKNYLEQRDGDAGAIRFCAGCHDPVLLFSGTLLTADPESAAANAGITCIGCHAISDIESPRGNGDYVIRRPVHYPFATSTQPLLQWVNHQLIRANPGLHKTTFLKPLHRQPEFCGTCHKVHIPQALNDYHWLRGQNHYDSFLLSGMSGAGVSSFYYPQRPRSYCGDCHMKPVESVDLAARLDPDDGRFKVHDHLMPGGHSALSAQVALGPERLERVREVLAGAVRLDLFGLRAEGRPDGEFIGPLGAAPLTVRPGQTYLLEMVLRNLTTGHSFTEGTADSNQVWVELTVSDERGLLYHSGKIAPETGVVDRDSHFVNSYVIDRNGKRITRRNVEDIYTTVYNNQIGPGAADTVHYRLRIPDRVAGQLTIAAKLQYRKFSRELVAAVAGDPALPNDLPVVTVATDSKVLQLGEQPAGEPVADPAAGVPLWERWNDYGIGLLLKPGLGQLKQAREAFSRAQALGSAAGTINLARTFLRGGQLELAAEELARVQTDFRVAPPWTRAWLESELALSTGRVDTAIALLKQLLASDFPEAAERGYDFSRDYRVWLRLGRAYWLRSRLERGSSRQDSRQVYLEQAEAALLQVLQREPENADAHYQLAQVYRVLGQGEKAARHRQEHNRYRPDDSARGRAVEVARSRDAAALRASNEVVVYPLTAADG